MRAAWFKFVSTTASATLYYVREGRCQSRR